MHIYVYNVCRQQCHAKYLHSINQLNTTNLTLSHMLHTTKRTLKALSTLVDLRLMHLDLSIGQQLPRLFPPTLAELEILRLSWHLHRTELEVFTNDSVSECALVLDLVVDLLDLLGINWQEGGVDSSVGRDCSYGNVWR